MGIKAKMTHNLALCGAFSRQKERGGALLFWVEGWVTERQSGEGWGRFMERDCLRKRKRKEVVHGFMKMIRGLIEGDSKVESMRKRSWIKQKMGKEGGKK